MTEGTDLGAAGPKLKYGLVGGGPGSFIAASHIAGIGMARAADIVAGCFSRGVKFVHDCVRSGKSDSAWVDGSAPVL